MISDDILQSRLKDGTVSSKVGDSQSGVLHKEEKKQREESALSVIPRQRSSSLVQNGPVIEKTEIYSKTSASSRRYKSSMRRVLDAENFSQSDKSVWKPKITAFQGRVDSYILKYKIGRIEAEAILIQSGFEIPLPLGQEYLSNYVMGRGGFGEFCVGFATKQNRYVGIKITHGSESVKNEVALYETLTHKGLQHILPIIDQHESINSQGEVILYQVMELAGLGSVDKLKDSLNLIRDVYFKEQVLFCLAEGLLQGLTEMHRAQFYHLDVKPNNLVVRQDGRVFLIDFGCSVQRDKAMIDMTGIMGDQTFFSPERHAGMIFLDATKIDAFAAGLTLIFLGDNHFSSYELENISDQLLDEFDAIIAKNGGTYTLDIIQRFFVQQLAKIPFLQNPNPDSFWSFVSSLLVLEPEKRFSPEQALKHPWFLKMQQASKEWLQQTTGYLRELVQAENREKRSLSPLDLPFPHFTSFVERGATQDLIVQRLLKESCDKIIITVCQGIGGVGKTQLVNFIVHLDAIQKHFGIKLWFRNADSPNLLDAQIVSLARELHLIGDKADSKEALEKLQAYLASESKRTGKPSIIIFDNAEEQEHLRAYFPTINGHCLITTRNTDWTGAEIIGIDIMSEAEAKALAIKLLRRQEPELLKLCQALGFLPLAIAQACAYINAELLSMLVYLEQLQKESTALSLLERDERSFGKKLPASVLGMWRITFQALKNRNPEALLLLDKLSYLSPDSIPKNLLSALGKLETQRILEKYALLQVNAQSMGSLHRLLQLAVRSKNEERSTEILISLMEVLNKLYDEHSTTLEAIKENAHLLPHGQAICTSYDKINSPTENLQRWFAATLSWLGNLQREQGAPYKALEYHQRALSIRQKIFGLEHPDVASSLNDLGVIYLALGNASIAMKYHKRALAIREKFFGKNHPIVADSLNNLGLTFRALADSKKASKYHERALAIQENEYGKEHPVIANSLSYLGLTVQNLGDPKRAAAYYGHALVIREKIYGKEHPAVALSLNNLGIVFEALGDIEEAIKYHKRALAIYEKIYGKGHPDVATSLSYLGSAYYSLKDNLKAAEYHQQAHAIREKIYGKEHPDVATCLTNIGLAHQSMGNVKTAVRYHRQALAIDEKIYGKEHPAVARDLNNLGLAIHLQGKVPLAIKYLKRAYLIRERNYGSNHPSVANSLNNLGLAFADLGQTSIALECHKRAYAIRKKVYGEAHSSVAISWNNLVSINRTSTNTSLDECSFTSQRAHQYYLFERIFATSNMHTITYTLQHPTGDFAVFDVDENLITPFFKVMNYKPKGVLFVDDHFPNIFSVYREMGRVGIECHAILYTRKHHHSSQKMFSDDSIEKTFEKTLTIKENIIKKFIELEHAYELKTKKDKKSSDTFKSTKIPSDPKAVTFSLAVAAISSGQFQSKFGATQKRSGLSAVS